MWKSKRKISLTKRIATKGQTCHDYVMVNPMIRFSYLMLDKNYHSLKRESETEVHRSHRFTECDHLTNMKERWAQSGSIEKHTILFSKQTVRKTSTIFSTRDEVSRKKAVFIGSLANANGLELFDNEMVAVRGRASKAVKHLVQMPVGVGFWDWESGWRSNDGRLDIWEFRMAEGVLGIGLFISKIATDGKGSEESYNGLGHHGGVASGLCPLNRVFVTNGNNPWFGAWQGEW